MNEPPSDATRCAAVAREAGRAAVHARDPAALALAVSRIVAGALHADGCWALLCDSGAAHMLGGVGIRPDGVPGARLPLRARTLAALALDADGPLVCGDLGRDGRIDDPALADTGARSLAVVAIPGRAGHRGLLAACATEPGRFGREDVAVLEVAGTLMAFALEKSAREVDALHRANHDALTGLPNRAALHAALRSRRERGLRTALAVLDLDGFKLVNDSLGHAAGDELLRSVALRLLEALTGDATVVRLGGDEFAVLPERAHAGRALRLVRAAVRGLEAPFALGAGSVQISASAGVAVGNLERSGTDLMRDADTALYDAKARGGGSVTLFRPELLRAARRRFDIETGLRAALPEERLGVHFQPVVDLAEGRPVGLEALARWADARLGDVPPSEFMPPAERAGLAPAIGRVVRRAACAAAASTGLPVAVNVAARELTAPGFVEGVRRAVASAGIGPAMLELELTESDVLADPARALPVLERLRALGIRLALDDFGTGASSLARLSVLPFDVLKIDRSFVAAMQRGRQGLALVEAALGVADAFELTVVAEGVETDAQRTALLAAGCRFGQGYLFARPAPLEDLAVAAATGAAPDPTLRAGG